MNLSEFLAARLDEDERMAKACPLPQWQASGPPEGGSHIGNAGWSLTAYAGNDGGGGTYWSILANGVNTHDPRHSALAHAAHHDPARVLREVAAKRAILICRDADGYTVPSAVLHALADVYSDHPDYDPGWKPAP